LTDALPDIPRQLTALAEWLACVVYIAGRPRFSWPKTIPILAAGFVVISVVQNLAGQLPLAYWFPGMFVAANTMLLLIVAAARGTLVTATFILVRAFILAEFMASLHWQIHCFFFLKRDLNPVRQALAPVWQGLTGVTIYAAVAGIALFLDLRQTRDRPLFAATRRDQLWASLIVVLTFCVSNLSFYTSATPLSGRYGQEVFYIRTLVDFCGLVAVYARYDQSLRARDSADMAAMTQLMRSQHDQYVVATRSIDAVQRAYHDFKHQIQAIRAETDPAARAAHLDDLESSVKSYEALTRTGHPVLDIVLTTKSLECAEKRISLTAVADGSVLFRLSPADIATLFGNALDNAIAATSRLPDPDERLIKVAVFSQAGFAVVTVENSFTGELRIEEGAIMTLHEDEERHGFGLKSIRYVAEKNGGTMTAHAEDDWFILRVLLPLPVPVATTGAASA
jgi:signal transduction histidine kinase